MNENAATEATINGKLLELPGGPVKIAIGGKYRWEKYAGETKYLNLPALNGATDRNRSLISGYGEIILPLFSEANRSTLLERLELNLSYRYERYSDFGHTDNPKLGILWSPVTGLQLRGTYSTSFRAPLLQELDEVVGVNSNFLLTNPDPTSPTGQSLQILRTGTANSDLQPQTAKSYTFGFEVYPGFAPEVKLGIGGFRVDYTNRIAPPNANSNLLLPNEQIYSDFIVRNPSQTLVNSLVSSPLFRNLGYTGPIPPTTVAAVVDARVQNISSLNIEGLDAEFHYLRPFGLNSFSLDVTGTELLKYREGFRTGSVSRINTPFYPTRWKARSDVGWTASTWSAHAAVNFVNSYADDRDPANVTRVRSFTTVDLQLAHKLWTGIGNQSFEAALTVLNLFDQQPPRVPSGYGPEGSSYGFNYDATNASALGRFVSLKLSGRF